MAGARTETTEKKMQMHCKGRIDATSSGRLDSANDVSYRPWTSQLSLSTPLSFSRYTFRVAIPSLPSSIPCSRA